MTKIIALGNQKGGVGKTSNALNICYSLANTYEKKVLLIDFDSQGSASLNLSIPIDDPNSDIRTIDDLLSPYVLGRVTDLYWDQSQYYSGDQYEDEDGSIQNQYLLRGIKDYIYRPTYETRGRDPENGAKWVTLRKDFGFDVIPAALTLAVVDLQMSLRAVGGKVRSDYLSYLIDIILENREYDFVVIDTPPALGALSMNGFSAAKDGIIVSSNLDIMSTRGIVSLLDSVSVITSINPDHMGVLGILLSLYSERRSVDNALMTYIKDFYPLPVFSTNIRESSDAKKANAALLLFSQINKKAKEDYDNLCKEIIYATENPAKWKKKYEKKYADWNEADDRAGNE